jgi:hypothetical protein
LLKKVVNSVPLTFIFMGREAIIVKIPNPETLGLTLARLNKGRPNFLAEAKKMDTLKRIFIGVDQDGDNVYLVTGTTLAASPHTPFVVPGDAFIKKATDHEPRIEADKENGQPNWDFSKNGPENSFYPPHLIHWAILEVENKEKSASEYITLDLYDLSNRNNKRGRYDRPQGIDPSTIFGESTETVLPELKKHFIDELQRRLKLADKILRDIYRSIYPDLEQFFINLINDPSQNENVSSLVKSALGVDAISVDHTMGIGHYAKRDEDGLGRGPQSDPNFHAHSVIYFQPEKIITLLSQLGYQIGCEKFNDAIASLNQMGILKGGIEFGKYDDEIHFKQIDPYSTLVFQKVNKLVRGVLERLIQEQGVLEFSIHDFSHHDINELITRIAEGWRIEIDEKDFAKVFDALLIFLGKIYDFWGEAITALEIYWTQENESQLKNVVDALLNNLNPVGLDNSDRLALIDNLINFIKRIKPTDKQKEKLNLTQQERPGVNEGPPNEKKGSAKKRKRVKQLRLSNFAQKELQQPTGYNIPGIPGFGLTIEYIDQRKLIVTFCPLLSQKGVGEQVTGAPLKRQ